MPHTESIAPSVRCSNSISSSFFQLYHSQQQYNADAAEENFTTAAHNTTTTADTSPTLDSEQKKWMFQTKYPIACEVARMSVSESPEDIDVKNNK